MLEHAHFSGLLEAVADSCNNLTVAFNSTDDSGEGVVVWEYSSALFLCVTMLTTIGKHNYNYIIFGSEISTRFFNLKFVQSFLVEWESVVVEKTDQYRQY